MPTKRERNGKWEYIIKRKALFPKPLVLRFEKDEEAKGDDYVRRLEAMLDKGIIPEGLMETQADTKYVLIGDVIRDYLATQHVPESDVTCLNVLYARIGVTRLKAVSYAWIEKWISDMKRELTLAPSTIRHHVGALGRCFDWGSKRGIPQLAVNPIRMLPKRYATYTDADMRTLEVLGKVEEADHENERDRRLHGADEEGKIRAVLFERAKPKDKERPLELNYRPAVILLFELALETAMRMREIYTLTLDQISIPNRTIFLDKTKNGDKRQVPLSSVALKALETYMEQVRSNDPEMDGWAFAENRLMPWWDGEKESLRKITAKLSKQFSRVFAHAGSPDLHFHDLRHEATSRLYERTNLTDVQIASITGHKDLRMLKRYANLRGSQLASKLW